MKFKQINCNLDSQRSEEFATVGPLLSDPDSTIGLSNSHIPPPPPYGVDLDVESVEPRLLAQPLVGSTPQPTVPFEKNLRIHKSLSRKLHEEHYVPLAVCFRN